MTRTYSFVVQVKVDVDHEGAPEMEEVKLQVEQALFNDPTEALAEFGIEDVKVWWVGNVEE